MREAIKIFAVRPYLVNRHARVAFRLGKLLHEMGQPVDADAMLDEGWKLRNRVQPDDARPIMELTDKDFDDLVPFTSR